MIARPCTVTFGIPLVGRALARDWGRIEELFNGTLAAIYRQSDENFRIIVACSDRPRVTVAADDRLEFIAMPAVVGLDLVGQREDALAKRRALGARLAHHGGGYLMLLDADDLVNRHLVEFVRRDRHPWGYIGHRGYLYDAEAGVIADEGILGAPEFDRVCASCAIIYFSAPDLAPGEGGTGYFDRLVRAGHDAYASVSAAQGRPLAPLPMPIATYVINTGQNLSQAADARWRSERFERLIRRVQAAGVAPAPGLIEDFALPLAQGPGPAGPRRDGPLLSVAISTRGRPAGLKRLLEAVLPQTDGRADREVVVVNDGSHDAAYAAVVAPLAGRLVYRPIPSGVGLPGARNLSARLARGEFVVFVDDDCVPPPWWLDWLAALIETRPDLDAVAGTCLALAPDRPSFAAAVNTRFRFIPRPWRTGGDLMLVGANMAVRRSTYWRIGGFAMVDGWPGAGEDAEFSRRLALDGARVVADGDWHVRHDVTAGLRTQMRRQWRYGYADPWLNRLPTGPKGLDRPERATVGGRIRIARGVFKDSYAQARGIAGSLAGRVAVAVVATLIRCSADAGYARAVRELAGGVTAPRP